MAKKRSQKSVQRDGEGEAVPSVDVPTMDAVPTDAAPMDVLPTQQPVVQSSIRGPSSYIPNGVTR